MIMQKYIKRKFERNKLWFESITVIIDVTNGKKFSKNFPNIILLVAQNIYSNLILKKRRESTFTESKN